MKNRRNVNHPPNADIVSVYLQSSWDIVRAIYDALSDIGDVADAINNGTLDDFLSSTDIDTIAKLNAILTDATLGDFASQAEAESGTSNVKTMTPLRVAQAIAVLAAGLLNKYDGTVAPGASDDNVAGYSVGSYWINIVASPNESYRCTDNSTGAAVWVKTTLTVDELAVIALTGDSDDLIEGTVQLLMTVAERVKVAAIDQVFTTVEKDRLALMEDNSTADQTDGEIETAYNNQVDQVSAGEKTAGTELAIRRFAPKDVADMAGTHGSGGGIGEAPEDGNQYARKDAGWEQVVSSGGGGGLTPEFKSANFTAEAGKKYFVNTIGGPVEAILPAGVNLDNIIIADDAHYAGTNYITVTPNGAETVDDDTVFIIDQDDGDIDIAYDSTNTNWRGSADGSPDLVNVDDFIVGRKTKAFFMNPDMRIGNAQQPSSESYIGATGGNAGFIVRAFDADAPEFVMFNWFVPNNFDESWGVSFIPIWSPATTDTGNAVFELMALPLPEGSAIDVDPPANTNYSIDAGLGIVGDIQYGPESTNNNALSLMKGNVVIFKMQRKSDEGTDNLTGDAYIIGIRLIWNTDQVNEDI